MPKASDQCKQWKEIKEDQQQSKKVDINDFKFLRSQEFLAIKAIHIKYRLEEGR